MTRAKTIAIGFTNLNRNYWSVIKNNFEAHFYTKKKHTSINTKYLNISREICFVYFCFLNFYIEID